MARPIAKHVQGSGPTTAPLVWIGEAPGKDETARGVPFVGASGDMVRWALRDFGLSPNEVRFDNVAPVNLGRVLPGQTDKVVDKWWDNLDETLTYCGGARVVVACGRVALRRLTGLKGVEDEHGGVIPVSDLPATIEVRGNRRPHCLPPDALVVPMIHPASVMYTALQAERLAWRRAVRRAVEYAVGQRAYAPVLPNCMVDPPPDALDYVLSKTTVVSVDTEFHRESKEPFLIGLLPSPEEGYILRKPFDRWLHVLRKHLSRPDLTLVSHYNPAEWQSFARVFTGGMPQGAAWHDTLLLFNALYPDVNVGLNHAALFYVDDARNWKDMPSSDPDYLLLDIWRQWQVYWSAREELERDGMWGLVEDEIVPAGSEMWQLEREGLRVDPEAQGRLRADNLAARQALSTSIDADVRGYVEGRALVASALFGDADQSLAEARAAWPGERCPLHEGYNPWRRKRWSALDDCCCKVIYESDSAVQWRTALKELKAQRTKARTVAMQSDRPFSPGNNNDLRWLCYEALRLPVQTNRETGSPTVNADAVQNLRSKMMQAFADGKQKSKYWRDDAETVDGLLGAIKEYQGLAKQDSTFLAVEPDGHGLAHPPYRAWGTGTGRPASGDDPDFDEVGGEFNVLNFPKECRELFVPRHDGWVFVSADWSQLESWLTATFAGDTVMLGELHAQLTGGPKVHALNAALIYDIAVEDAATHYVPLKGRQVTAYTGGKRMSHLINYGGRDGMVASTFWLPRAFARAACEKLWTKYALTTAWRGRLADDVFGRASYACPSCRALSDGPSDCLACSVGKRRVRCRFVDWEHPPRRVHYTPFRRRRWYLGRRVEGANALASQDPQSSGASMAYRTLCRLRGYEMRGGRRQPWPTPPFDYEIDTFTYDEFTLECHPDNAMALGEWLVWTMEQPWPALGGLRVPADVSIGWNWGGRVERDGVVTNPRGLVGVDVGAPLTVERPSWLVTQPSKEQQ